MAFWIIKILTRYPTFSAKITSGIFKKYSTTTNCREKNSAKSRELCTRLLNHFGADWADYN